MKPLSEATAKVFAPITFATNDRLVITSYDDSFALDFHTRDKSALDGRTIICSPSYNALTFLKRFPESKELTKSDLPCHYMVAATDYTVELLTDLVPHHQIAFGDREAETKFRHILARSRIAELCAERVANFKLIGALTDHQWELREEKELAWYQQVPLVNLMSLPADSGYGLFMEQGTGKTPVGVATICNLAATRNRVPPLRVLILVPKNVRRNWENEIQQFTTRFGITTILEGTEVARVRQLIEAFPKDDPSIDFTVVICSYETMVNSLDVLSLCEWDICIADEAHMLKDAKTKRFKAACKIRDVSQLRIAMTGTPIANSILDLYAIFEFMGKGYSGFAKEEAFRRYYGRFIKDAGGFDTLVGAQNLPFMQERLLRYTFGITMEEAQLHLPEKVYDIHEVEMSEPQAAYYKELATQLGMEIEAEMCSDNMSRSMMVENVLTKLLRLEQITSGFVKWDDGRIEYFSPNPKIEALRELCSDKPATDKTIIWACFTPDIDYICAMLEADGHRYVRYTGSTNTKDRDFAEHEFNFNPECKFFVGNAGAGGCGLNLLGYPPNAAGEYITDVNHTIYYSQNWSVLLRGQSEARAYRRGTRRPMRVTDLVVLKTIDEQIRTRVVQKKIGALEISDLRAIIRGALFGEKGYERETTCISI